MRFNPTALAALLLCAMNSMASTSAPTGSDSLPDLPLPVTLQQGQASAPITAPQDAALTTASSNQNVSNSISFTDMGANSGVKLSGQQLQNGLSFTLPGDLVITDAHLTLSVKVSDADASGENLQLMLNGQPLGAIPLDQLQQGKGVWELDVPASMIASNNNLSFQLKTGNDIINNTWSCQRALPGNYQVTLQPESVLNYNGLWLNVRKTLSTFPRPFYDNKQMKDAVFSIAYPASPDADLLMASAIVASQFGVINTAKVSQFDVKFNDLPAGNGIVFGKPGDHIGSVVIEDNNGPSLRIIDNPVNPAYKLLVVSGRNEAELRQAAWRITQPALPDSDTLQVPAIKIAQRAPYDAPRWVSTAQPVPLKTLQADDGSLVAHGIWHGENQLPFRTAPDLFMWDGSTIPLRLNYSFAQKNWIDDQNSFLNVSLNGEFIKRLPVNKEGLFAPVFAMLGLSERQQSAVVNIDPHSVYGSNQIGFYFGMKATANAPCSALADDNIQSRVDSNSSLDLTHAWHFGQLPNLAWFSSAMFPFTRNADLSHTAVVLPAHPAVEDATLLLSLMAQSGRNTGVPTNYVHVYTGVPQQDSEHEQLADSDVLAIGSLKNSELLNPILQGSAFSLNETSLEINTPDTLRHVISLLKGDWSRNDADAASYLSDTNQWRGFLSLRSPWNPQRVVVVATATDGKQLQLLPVDMNKPAFHAGATGDMTLVSGTEDIKSWRVGDTFTTGDLPGYLHILWYASQHIFFLAIIVCLIAACASPLLYTWLRRHAQQRLHGTSPNE